MTLNELEQIIKKLRYYGVDKRIENVSLYLQSLTRTEINNILSMNYKNDVRTFFLESFYYIKIFENRTLLNSEKFNEILDIILVKYPEKYKKVIGEIPHERCKKLFSHCASTFDLSFFYDILSTKEAFYSKHIFNDIESIYNKLCELLEMCKDTKWENGILDSELMVKLADESEKVKTMKKLSTNKVSLNKPSHITAMNEISKAGSAEKAKAIFSIEALENFESCYDSYEYFKIIDKAKTDKVVKCLKELILEQKALKAELEEIVNAETEEMSLILSYVVETINSSDEYNNAPYTCLDDLKIISETENIEVAHELAKLATSLESIKSHKHEEQMRTISALTDAVKAKSFVNVLLNKKDSFDELDVILYNAQRYVDDYECATELPASVFKINKKYNK